jgi:hypothetical protein
MKIFSEVQSKEKDKIRIFFLNVEELSQPENYEEIVCNRNKEKFENICVSQVGEFEILSTHKEETKCPDNKERVQNYSVFLIAEFEIERAYVPYVPPTVISITTVLTKGVENTLSRGEEISIEASFTKLKNIYDYSLSQASEIQFQGKPFVPSFDQNSLRPDLLCLEIQNLKKKENYISYFSSFEIRSPQKIKFPNYIIKEENFTLSLIRKETESIRNQALSSSDFCAPKNYKIVNSKTDLLSQSIQDKSTFKIEGSETKTTTQFNKYQYSTTKTDLNKSELIVENELNNTTANIQQNDLGKSNLI